MLQNLVPRPHARHRSVHHTETPHPIRVLGHKCEGDHVADVVRHNVGRVDAERVQNARHVFGLVLLVEAHLNVGRKTHAAQVGGDHGVVVCQLGGERRPHVAGFPVTVQQHDRRPLSADAHVDGRAVGHDVLCSESLGISEFLGGRRAGEGEGCERENCRVQSCGHE
jgi:hypothetical protein